MIKASENDTLKKGQAEEIRLFRASEIARLLSCSKGLVYKLADQGQIRCFRFDTGGGRSTVRFRKDDVLKFLEKHLQK